jgi:hypothetical protein
MVRLSSLVFSALLVAACASSSGRGPTAVYAPPSGGRAASTDDPRVRSFQGQVPPELSADVRWLNAPASTLAALRGRVVFVQFAFPT